jgi:hypothetical protein
MKKLLIIGVFFAQTITAQNIDNSITLKWRDNIIFDKTTDGLSFEGASVDSHLFPVYNSVLPYNGQNIDGYKLSNIQTEEIPSALLSKMKDLEVIGSEFIVKAQINYARKEPFVKVTVFPIRKSLSTGKYERLTSFSLLSSMQKSANVIKSSSSRTYKSTSVLHSGTWVKIKIQKTGIYKLTYAQIKALGINDPANLRIYGNGGSKLSLQNKDARPDDLNEMAIQFITGNDGIFNDGDYVIFYAQGTTVWSYDIDNKAFTHKQNPFSAESYYFLTSDLGKGKTIETQNPSSAAITDYVTSFDNFDCHELNTKNLIESGAQWFGEEFSSTLSSTNVTFSFPTYTAGATGKIYYNVASRSNYKASFKVSYNNNVISTSTLGTISYANTEGTYAQTLETYSNITPTSGNISLSITYQRGSDPYATGWLDYVGINIRQPLQMQTSQLTFRDIQSVGTGKTAHFSIANANASTEIWDVTDISTPVKINASLNGSTLSFSASSAELKEYVAFNSNGDLLTPIISGDGTGVVDNQNLHGLSNPDFIIITHKNFKASAEKLAEFKRTHDNLNTIVVTNEQIYNEFSSGKPDVAALRDFVKMFYDRATSEAEIPKYLLLMGDGSYNNFSTDANNPNYVLTYQSNNSTDETGSYVTDDFFGLLDDNEGEIDGKLKGLLDIGIGRFPVQTATAADSMVSKVKRYATASNMGSWRNQISFLVDDDELGSNEFTIDADGIAETVRTQRPDFNVEKLYLDAFQQVTSSTGQSYPDVDKAFEARIRKGVLIMNYVGHSGILGLSSENVVSTNKIAAYDNYSLLPLFITASCQFSRWDGISISGSTFSDKTSAGELTFLNTKGGAIALYSATRNVFESGNIPLVKNFYSSAFELDKNGEEHRLGDLIRLSKNSQGNDVNTFKFTLLGDPSLKLAYPRITNIATDSINGVYITENADTAKALNHMRICGHVNDASGNLDKTFNGTVFISIFDKVIQRKTLSNEGSTVMSFNAQENVIYRGKATVNNGRFSFSFIVPKDINYSVGPGKISYYAENGTVDRSGYSSQINIGGLSTNALNDTKGPEINLYLNSKNFANGAVVNTSPTIYACINDENGINTSGNGVGHDLTAIFDDDINTKLTLNDFYENEQDSYSKGSLTYPLSNLKEGSHTLKVKAWDVANNSSESEINFVVAESGELILKHVLNYPNPFTTNTSFYFNHNKANQSLDVQIQIFTVSGKLVKSIQTTITPSGFLSDPILWDGRDDFGDRIGKGVYIYRLKVKDSEGNSAEKFEKLVILH